MEKDGLLEGIFYIVLSIGLVSFGSILIWTIYFIGYWITNPSSPDLIFLYLISFVEIILFVIGLCFFISGVITASEALSGKKDEGETEDDNVHPPVYVERILRIPCKECKGTKRCKKCKGKGKRKDSQKKLMLCDKCGGSGKCQTCKGNGS